MDNTSSLLEALFARRPEFHRYLRTLGFAPVAEDVLQSAYLRVIERGISVRDPDKLVPWFRIVLRNAALDHVRGVSRQQRLHARAACVSPTVATEEEADIDGALATLRTLPPPQHEVLDHVYVRGASMAQLAANLGITRNAASVRVHRARRALRSLLQAAPP